jgi:hypothetical protein
LLARVFSRTADDTRLFDYEMRRDDHQVSVVARRTSRDSTLYPQAMRLDAANGNAGDLAFREVAPGHFVARLPFDPSTTVRVLATAHSPAAPEVGQQPTRLVSTALDDVAREEQADPERGLDLEALAKATGGAYTSPEQMAAGNVEPRTSNPEPGTTSLSARNLWPALLLISLLLYLAEITWRRWPRSAGVTP